MDELRIIFELVFDLAQEDLDFFGYMFSPFDFWLTTAILLMLVDLILWQLGYERD